MRRRNNLIATIAVALVLSVAGYGCKKNEPAPAPPVAKPKPPAPKPVQAQSTSAKHVATAGPSFDFSAKKDPFKPFLAAPKPQVKPSAPLGQQSGLPIQSYDLSQFRVIGLIAGLKENKGMVVDPTGKGYVVREGMVIGRNGGRIMKITATAIEVAEQYRDDNGKIRKRVVRLTLPRKD